MVLRTQRRSLHFSGDCPSNVTPEGPRCYYTKPDRPLNRRCCVKTKYTLLSKHQLEDRFCSGKGRKAVADEPVPIPSPVPFYCKSLRINMVKKFKTAFNYLSRTSIMKISQGTVILPVLLSTTLESRELFSQPPLHPLSPFSFISSRIKIPRGL